ncbi:hypothetical protein IV102_33590 [bacterium]|nr:hypothetical protein [bacterium]
MLRIVLFLVVLVYPVCAQNPRELERAIKSEYPGGYEITVERFSIVPYGQGYFALTRGRSNDVSEHYAVWETLNGRWSYIFDYNLNGRFLGSPKELDELYGRHRLSSKMRQQLVGGNSCAFPPSPKARPLTGLEQGLLHTARRHFPPGGPFMQSFKFLKANLAASHGSMGVISSGMIAVWRKQSGKWRLVFEYRPWAMSNAQIAALYARHDLTPEWRQRIEHFDYEKDQIHAVSGL